MSQCFCTHAGEDHSPHEPRVCKHIDCNCYKFRESDPYAQFLTTIDRYIEKFDDWYDRMFWLAKNLNFICGFTNTELVFWYWRYVYPKWDAETEFLSEELKKAIQGDAKPESITRGMRLVKEKNPDFVEKHQHLKLWQSYNEEGYREGAIGQK